MNEQALNRLKQEIAVLLFGNTNNEEAFFQIIDMTDEYYRTMERDLHDLKETFVDVASVNSGEPLAKSYRILKERIHAAGRMSEPGFARQKRYEEHEATLRAQGIDQASYRSYLDNNRDRLLALMQDANMALKNLKIYQQTLGSKDEFEYLDMVLDPSTVKQAMQQYHFVEDMPYEYLQRFAACTRTVNAFSIA